MFREINRKCVIRAIISDRTASSLRLPLVKSFASTCLLPLVLPFAHPFEDRKPRFFGI